VEKASEVQDLNADIKAIIQEELANIRGTSSLKDLHKAFSDKCTKNIYNQIRCK